MPEFLRGPLRSQPRRRGREPHGRRHPVGPRARRAPGCGPFSRNGSKVAMAVAVAVTVAAAMIVVSVGAAATTTATTTVSVFWWNVPINIENTIATKSASLPKRYCSNFWNFNHDDDADLDAPFGTEIFEQFL
jgi:hypothetical protein